MTQPRTLEELDYPAIKRLVVDGFYETDTFEFKPSLKPVFGDPKKRDEFNERILNSVCAFANTYGGFMVFGIEDLKNKSGEDRIVGLDRTDLAAEFGERIKSIDPIIYYNFKNPPIPIPNKDKVIFVVHIPFSSTRPHQVSLFHNRTVTRYIIIQ